MLNCINQLVCSELKKTDGEKREIQNISLLLSRLYLKVVKQTIKKAKTRVFTASEMYVVFLFGSIVNQSNNNIHLVVL